MKKIITLLAVAFLAMPTQSFASHLMGGEITAMPDPNNPGDVIVNLTVYRDAAGVNLGQTANILVEWNNSSSTITLNRVKLDSISLNPVYERHFYQGSFTLVDTIAFHALSYSLCCRNTAIINVGTSANFYIRSGFQPGNHTSVFLSPPVVKFPKDTTWTYNPMPIDFEGDSLHWRISVPKTSLTDTVSGYYAPPANPGGELSMDSTTGVISWNPSQLGNFVFAVSVTEWRNGVLVGKIKRDMQVLVVADTSQLKVVPPANPNITTINGVNTMSLTANSSNSFLISLTSGDSAATLEMEAFGEPFQVGPSSATFSTVLKKTGGTLEGTFDWSPPANLKGNDYRMMVRLSDGNFSYDYSLTLSVDNVFAISEKDASSQLFEIFPNPVENSVSLTSDFYQGPVSLRLLGMDGKLIQKTELTSGERTWLLSSPKSGAYLLEIQYEGKVERKQVLFR